MSFFKDPDSLPVFACEHVFYEGEPVLYVCHDGNNLWQFHCGQDHADEDAVYLSLSLILDFDLSILELADLPAGKQARRASPKSPWEIF